MPSVPGPLSNVAQLAPMRRGPKPKVPDREPFAGKMRKDTTNKQTEEPKSKYRVKN